MARTPISGEDSFIPTSRLGKEQGFEFGWNDRLFYGWQEGRVFDYGDWEARDLHDLLAKDYKARQIESVLCLPIISATHSITPAKKDKGEAEWLSAFFDADPLSSGCRTPLRLVIDQMTSAFSYRRAFFEKVWDVGTGDFAGKTVYSKLAWRPQTTCRLVRHDRTGEILGFEQDSYHPGAALNAVDPIFVKRQNAFIYVHGARRDPINGLSAMDIPYWAYRTKQKVMFLWFQFLEGVSLPRTIVQTQDEGSAKQIGRNVAALRNSGVLPVTAPGGPDTVKIQSLDLSGKGAEQFMAAIKWLDSCATNSVLAGFLDLTQAAASGPSGGSWALSRDASDFYLQTRESDAHEIAYSIRRDLFAPLIRVNFGPNAAIPLFTFEPLNDEDKATSVTLLQTLMQSRDPALIPDEFIGELAQQVADYLGLNGDKVRKAFEETAAKVEATNAAAAQAAASGQLPPRTAPGRPAPPNAANLAPVAAAVGQAHRMVRAAQNGNARRSGK